MPLMSGDLYDALLEAGASEAKARKAAEAVANYDQRFSSLEGKIETLRAQLLVEMAWIKWMIGTNLVFTLGVLWKVFKP